MISQSKALVVKKDENGDSIVVEAPETTVLDEDEYVEQIEKIIERDFFPDLYKWRDQREYLDAKKKRDYSKMISISQKYTKSKIFDTFATLETPNFNATPMEAPIFKKQKVLDDDVDSKKDITDNLTLAQFLNKYTGEDNASYSKLMEKQSNDNPKRKFWQEHYNKLKAIEANPSAGVLTWPVTLKNQLMYVPDGIKSSISTAKKVIEKDNTRIAPEVLIKVNTIKKKSTKSDSLPLNMTSREQYLQELKNRENKPIDLGDLMSDAEESPNATPQVGGYSFVSTPQIDPNVGNESPIITWGEIEGTPLLLESGTTPLLYDDGPSFKMPEPRKRELLHMELTKKKQEKPSSKGSLTPKIGNRTPIHSKEGRRMAAKIMKSKFGDSFDPQLRASYNSPMVRKHGGSYTPSTTPKRTPTLTPKK